MNSTKWFNQIFTTAGSYFDGRRDVDIAEAQAKAAAQSAAAQLSIIQGQNTTYLLFGALALVGLFIWRTS